MAYSTHHLNPPEEPEQKLLFDAEPGAWWHTQLSPEGLQQLSEGTEGVMRRSILKLLPAKKQGERFHEFPGGRARSCTRCAG